MSQPASPRGTFLKIAEVVRARIDADPKMTELPTAADLMGEFGVSRGVALRVFDALQEQGVAERVAGSRLRVVRRGEAVDRRTLTERLADVITNDQLLVGEPFPSSTKLCARFGVSRPTLAKALHKLEAAGLLSEGKQGKPRTVLSLPKREESVSP
ncbi:GntR family transcriptional regulator [Streptomyces sp. ID05-18]|uniref:GntR family transcriptional regulator n=1 Tax=Streptomyces sp. ID05-18 TaxID=3028662 RepID=UPI0029B77B4F|nr:GntR family transcriptional regulator [Streptomyces sp. ID05-18]MDX3490613.1 GntR family transcriptional regulator [Streptomyces sp. ID05-18]